MTVFITMGDGSVRDAGIWGRREESWRWRPRARTHRTHRQRMARRVVPALVIPTPGSRVVINHCVWVEPGAIMGAA